MIIIVGILIYCILLVIKRILKPRTFPRRCDYNLENNLLFLLICGAFVSYKVLTDHVTINQLRNRTLHTVISNIFMYILWINFNINVCI